MWRRHGDDIRLRFRQSPYTRHRLEATSSLTAPDWLPLGDLTVDADGLLEWQPPLPDSSPRFYRTVPLP